MVECDEDALIPASSFLHKIIENKPLTQHGHHFKCSSWCPTMDLLAVVMGGKGEDVLSLYRMYMTQVWTVGMGHASTACLSWREDGWWWW